MMLRRLSLHPDSRCASATRIGVAVQRWGAGGLALTFTVEGKIANLRIQPEGPSARADELWKHTCFEAFVRAEAGEAYYEFNFSPSGAWAAYRFSSYRQGMAPVEPFAAPRIEARASADVFELRASLEWPEDAGPELALSAVIEDVSGAKSYWALAHPPGPPDFHHADGFVYSLERAEKS